MIASEAIVVVVIVGNANLPSSSQDDIFVTSDHTHDCVNEFDLVSRHVDFDYAQHFFSSSMLVS